MISKCLIFRFIEIDVLIDIHVCLIHHEVVLLRGMSALCSAADVILLVKK